MNKLIKLSETHYVIIDDSEISYNPDGGTNGHFLCLHELQYGWKEAYVKNVGNCKGCRKITHSTENLDGVQYISLPEIEVLVYGYDVAEFCNDKVHKIYSKYIPTDLLDDYVTLFELGFKAHQKLTKDKIYTIEDIRKAIILSATSNEDFIYDRCDKIIQRMLPKTIWDISIDENNKIVLL